MKTNILKYGMVLGVVSLMATSCSDMLNLEPIDYYGSSNYWKSEAHADGYIDGLHNHLRSYDWTHQIVFGELRGGSYNKTGMTCDGTSTADNDIILQNFDADHTGVSKFADIYGRITNCNLFIIRTTDADYIPEAKKKFYLGIAYGLRAFYYFDLYKVFGGVPLRLGVEVVDGELEQEKLYLERSKPSEVMAQIKSDLNKSLEYFGNVNNFDPYGKGAKAYWSKAATEALMADVYMWNAKVSIGDQKAVPEDLKEAKKHLLSLTENYGLELLPNFADIFDAKNKANKEIIFAIRYAEGEATNNYGYYTYSGSTGSLKTDAFYENGKPWAIDSLQIKNGYVMRYEYSTDLCAKYDKEDTRRAATMLPAYRKNSEGKMEHVGNPCVKNIGYINATGDRIFCSDNIYYRLAWVYTSLAEIANEEGNYEEVAKYINLLRKRAYGEKWTDKYEYKSSTDYKTNSLAILAEKDKEFVQEGQRWWDLNRMTLTKNGDHLVFCKEGSLKGDKPLLNKVTEAYKVLWPLDKQLLGNDTKLKQTPGYGKDAQQEEEVW